MGVTLTMWTLYDSPADMPGYFVLRRFEVDCLRAEEITVPLHRATCGATGPEILKSFRVDRQGPRPSPEAYWSKDVESLRDKMRERRLHCLPRQAADEPHIVEVWL